MKLHCSKSSRIALTVLNISLLFSAAASAQAPASIAGKTFGVGITGGDGFVFDSSGFYLFVPANSGSSFQVFNPDGSIETGTYSSYSASGPTATANLTVSTLSGYTINGKFYFMTPLLGTNSLTVAGAPSYYQNGDFTMFTNPVPSSIVAQNFYVNVQTGGGLFTSSGDFVFSPASSGNAYTITALSAGGVNSSGTYSYSRPNSTCGQLQLSDSLSGSSTVYVALTNSVQGGYYLTSANGYQAGYVTLLNSQAPPSIAGKTIVSAVTSGTPPLATTGYFIFLPANSGNGYQVIGFGGDTNSSGTYSYTPSGAAGTINLADSVSGSLKVSFFYFASLGGSYALAAGPSGQYTQTGDFTMFTNPVPNSIAGQSFLITVMNGSYPFATSGSFELATAASGNSYTITEINGSGVNSTGTYSYGKLNTTCGGIQLTDSVTGVSTVYVAFSNSVSGAYVLTQPSSGGYQVGFVSLLPALGIVHQSRNIVLSWPTNLAGFLLEYATNLPTASWFTNASSPYIVNGQFTITNAVANGTKFYRLFKP